MGAHSGDVLAAISLPGVPFGTALGTYGLWVLLNAETARLLPPAAVRCNGCEIADGPPWRRFPFHPLLIPSYFPGAPTYDPSCTHIAALLLAVLALVCWGSSGQHLQVGGRQRFELFYWDFALGVMVVATAAALTFAVWASTLAETWPASRSSTT